MELDKYCGVAAMAVALTVIAMPASATESGPYVGVNIGQSKFKTDDIDYSAFDSVKLDDSDFAWSMAVGYRFAPFIGIEASYVDLGKTTYKASGRVRSAPLVGNAESSVSAKGPALAVVAAVPIHNWELSAKVGAFFAKTKTEASFVGQTLLSPVQRFNLADSESASTTEVVAGLGVGYTIANHFHVRADWTRFPKVGDKEKTGEGDITMISTGFQYRF